MDHSRKFPAFSTSNPKNTQENVTAIPFPTLFHYIRLSTSPKFHPKKTTSLTNVRPKLLIISGQPTAASQVLHQRGPIGRRETSLQALPQLVALCGVAEARLQQPGLASAWRKTMGMGITRNYIYIMIYDICDLDFEYI